ncbi:hypothetical protein THAOC_07048 [Thalassiosira oceanica]|uniref:Uncharacterized protein n=1 Tax=Thalassiosira oceanica TaxID=159749 RepID=K0T182_THAOC|nr:hypothetical protein THAOC_07048 [Thalassiosira oceanica]|eukprot:EJK71505.1 hypothetical protein THAOC_07048 [Thalassiosira oceanica]
MARSVLLLGSSGGGTATLGHTDAVDVITTIHLELLKLRGCSGISRAIFVSLCDGSGFDCIHEDHWLPSKESRRGPLASLYTVGFGTSTQHTQGQLQVENVCTGPLTYINYLAKNLDDQLAQIIRDDDGFPSAIISISSSTVIHDSSLKACSELNPPVAGSGGTSLSNIASAFDLRIIGNSGGSVASTTITKAKGWAQGLSNEWGVAYDDSYEPEGFAKSAPSQSNNQPIPSLKSILEAALPSFLVLCIANFALDSFGGVAKERTSIDRFRGDEDILRFVLRCIVPGTICCILAATSRNTDTKSDQSTLIQTSTLAGILSSAAAFHGMGDSMGGGAMAGLVAGSTVPKSLNYASILCRRYNVTATMTNCILGGGVGIVIGLGMHISGLSFALSLLTGMIRQTIRFEILAVPDIELSSIEKVLPYLLVKVVCPVITLLQNVFENVASLGALSSTLFDVQGHCSETFLPIPIGLGFFSGCVFVYGSKVGWYHSAFLPLILLEMDSSGEASLLGAMDQCTLVMICAGICSANLLSRPKKTQDRAGDGQSSLARQALKTNLCCGDFIVSG